MIRNPSAHKWGVVSYKKTGLPPIKCFQSFKETRAYAKQQIQHDEVERVRVFQVEVVFKEQIAESTTIRKIKYA